ncbi:unnamed protein product [Clavelina lepadiformis]|uniref:Uncharacterized protein n=1 Tax=Clavelina lepadiformis TaxID=159417 RepID=A0ABP0FQE1_CLALP
MDLSDISPLNDEFHVLRISEILCRTQSFSSDDDVIEIPDANQLAFAIAHCKETTFDSTKDTKKCGFNQTSIDKNEMLDEKSHEEKSLEASSDEVALTEEEYCGKTSCSLSLPSSSSERKSSCQHADCEEVNGKGGIIRMLRQLMERQEQIFSLISETKHKLKH